MLDVDVKITKKMRKEIDEIINDIPVSEIFEYISLLDFYGYKTIRGLMVNYFTYNWEQSTKCLAIAELIDAIVYYDKNFGCWIERDI